MLTVQEFMLVTATFLAYVTLAWLVTSDIVACGVPVLLGHEIGSRTIAAPLYNMTRTAKSATAVTDTGMLALGRNMFSAAIKEWER